jgi:hypothetical protein
MRDADTVYDVLLTVRFDQQRAINLEELLSGHAFLKHFDFRAALEVLESEGKLKLNRSARGDILSIYSGRQDCYKMYYQIEVFVQTDRKGFKTRIYIRHAVTPISLGTYLKDPPGVRGWSPNEAYASAEEAFTAGLNLAKRDVDEKYPG